MRPYHFNIGDKVWLQAKQIKIHQKSAKLGPKQLGPFAITEVLSDVNTSLLYPLHCNFMMSFMLIALASIRATK